MNISKNKLRSYLEYQQIKDVINDFTELRYAIVKGEVLSKQCYGKLGERVSCDIDLLVPRESILYVEEILYFHGFKYQYNRNNRVFRLANSHELGAFIKEESGIRTIIDLNFDIFWGEYKGNRININDFLIDTINIDIYGITLKTLSLYKTIIHVVLHHYKELNSIYHLSINNSLDVNKFKDIYFIIKNNIDKICVDKLFQLSKEYEVIPYMYYMFYYTNEIYHDELLDIFCNKFNTDYGEFLLNHYGLNDEERKVWKVDFNSRLSSTNIFNLIKDEISEKDMNKILLNKSIFV